jgi:hypothetical protein
LAIFLVNADGVVFPLERTFRALDRLISITLASEIRMKLAEEIAPP